MSANAKCIIGMTHDELSIDLRTEEGGVLVFKLRGSLDLATAPTVRVAMLAKRVP